MMFSGLIRERSAGVLFIAACCLSASITPAHAAPGAGWTIGGTASGLLRGSKITLVINAKETVDVTANGKFTFPSRLADGATYEISIEAQPDMLRCIVHNGSGTARASIANINITCPMAFKKSLVWMRCSHGQVWNASRGDCTGTGTATSFGAIRLRYCDKNDTSCNGGDNSGPLSNASPIFAACDALNAGSGAYGIRTWRVPTKEELSDLVVCSDGTVTPLNDYGTDPYKCGYRKPNYVNGSFASPTLDASLFPNTPSLEYWTATPAEKQASSAWYTGFQNGWTYVGVKSGQSYLRCVSGP